MLGVLVLPILSSFQYNKINNESTQTDQTVELKRMNKIFYPILIWIRNSICRISRISRNWFSFLTTLASYAFANNTITELFCKIVEVARNVCITDIPSKECILVKLCYLDKGNILVSVKHGPTYFLCSFLYWNFFLQPRFLGNCGLGEYNQYKLLEE